MDKRAEDEKDVYEITWKLYPQQLSFNCSLATARIAADGNYFF